MKKSFFLYLASLVMLALLMVNSADAQERKISWKSFSQNLVEALASDNEGLKLSAMGMIIRYGDSLDVKDAAFDIIRIFKFHQDQRVRRFAAVTLHKIGHPYAMYFLKRQIQFEKDDCIRKHCCCMVNEYYTKKNEQEESEPVLLSAQK